MGGGEVPSGFPLPNPVESYWQVPPHPIANHRTTDYLPDSNIFDYIIVGSGISGATVAHKLLTQDDSLSILMLEARTSASGASGRNGGHCRAGFYLMIKKFVHLFGEEEALKCLSLEEQNVKDMANFVHEYNVDCDFRDVETADTYVTEDQWNAVLDVMKMMAEIQKRRSDSDPLMERKIWTGQAAREHMRMPAIVGAVTYPAHSLNPYLLVCRMLELSLEKGMNLQTNTLVLDVVPSTLSDGSTGWAVTTARGTTYGKQVVLATNAFTNALHPGLRETQFLTPSRSQVTAIRPGRNISGDPVFRGSSGLNDFNGSGDYFMSRLPGLKGEGDVIYGGGRSISKTREMGITDDTRVNPDIANYLHHAPVEFFGESLWGEEGDVVKDWCGITCYTPDSCPLVGEAPGQRGLWMSVGMNGHGSKFSLYSSYMSQSPRHILLSFKHSIDEWPRTNIALHSGPSLPQCRGSCNNDDNRESTKLVPEELQTRSRMEGFIILTDRCIL
jgi:glycine/D-amino acid oxidase-like deaminating enzyme